MRDKVKRMLYKKNGDGNYSISLQRRLMLYWIFLIGIFSVTTLLTLGFLGIIPGTRGKVADALVTQQSHTLAEINRYSERMEAKSLILSRESSKVLNKVLGEQGKLFSDLNDNQELILDLESTIYPVLLSALDIKDCSGVFVVFDATVNTKVSGSETSRMGIYLRNSDLRSINAYDQDVAYFRGMPNIARAEKIQMHNRWNLEFDITGIPGYDKLTEKSDGRLAESCLWTTRVKLKDTWEHAQFLCVPVLDSAGNPVGACGMELSSLYFRLLFPRMKGDYGDMITVIAPLDQEGNFLLEEAMFGDTRGTYLTQTGTMEVRRGRKFNSYSTESQTYVGKHTILDLKPAGDKSLAAVTLISETAYNRIVERNKRGWTIGIIIFLILLIGISVYLSRHFAEPIVRGIQAIQSEGSAGGHYSGISEFDALIAFLDSRGNESHMAGMLPEEIEDMLMNFAKRAERLTPAEKTLLQYYIDGYVIEETAELLHISISTARKHNTNLNKKLEISTREELMLYIELFRKCDRLDSLSLQ